MYEDTRHLDTQMEVIKLRKENEQLRRQLEDVRMHVATVERLWRKMKEDMEIKS